MRPTPVSRDEVTEGTDRRWDEKVKLWTDIRRIATFPADAFAAEPNTLPRDRRYPILEFLRPIPELWRPLLEELGLGEGGVHTFTDRDNPQGCPVCDRLFYRRHGYRTRCCSDRCREKYQAPLLQASRDRQSAKQSARRAEARAGRKCDQCGKSLEAERSSKRYCSTNCRVAAHRRRDGD
jgi:hypothetical protein